MEERPISAGSTAIPEAEMAIMPPRLSLPRKIRGQTQLKLAIEMTPNSPASRAASTACLSREPVVRLILHLQQFFL